MEPAANAVSLFPFLFQLCVCAWEIHQLAMIRQLAVVQMALECCRNAMLTNKATNRRRP